MGERPGQTDESRQGRQKLAITFVTSSRCLASLRDSVAPDGAADHERLVAPPMNRWAMIGCPCRDKEELAVEANAISMRIFEKCRTLEALLRRGCQDSIWGLEFNL